MNKTCVNPWEWSKTFGYNQGVVIEAPKRQLIISGQTSMNDKGEPVFENDMEAQIIQSLDNLEAVLTSAEFNFEDVVKLGIFTTDIEATKTYFGHVASRFAGIDATITMVLAEVQSLAIPSLMFEIEAIAFQ